MNAERALEVFNPPADERTTREHAEDGTFGHSVEKLRNGKSDGGRAAEHRAQATRAIAAAPPEVRDLYTADLIGKR
jgi:hypothetical protein